MMELLNVLLSLLSLCTLLAFTGAQNCYYPNGDLTQSNDQPCSSGNDVACCPFNWQCLSNNLCYDPNQGYYGRYTCTDRTWKSGSCPIICTNNNQAAGNEAIGRCSNGKYCCNGNRSSNCCDDDDTDFFDLPEGHAIATVIAGRSSSPFTQTSATNTKTPNTSSPTLSVSTTTAAKSVSTNSLPVSSTPNGLVLSVPSSKAPSPTSTSDRLVHQSTVNTPQISVSLLISNSSNAFTTVLATSTVTILMNTSALSTGADGNTNTSVPNFPHHSNDKVLGPAIGVSLFASLIFGILAFTMWRRHQKKGKPVGEVNPYDWVRAEREGRPARYRPVSEIDGRAIRSASEIDGRAIRPASEIDGREIPRPNATAGRPISMLVGSPTAAAAAGSDDKFSSVSPVSPESATFEKTPTMTTLVSSDSRDYGEFSPILAQQRLNGVSHSNRWSDVRYYSAEGVGGEAIRNAPAGTPLGGSSEVEEKPRLPTVSELPA